MRRGTRLALIVVLAVGLIGSGCAGPGKSVVRKGTPKVMATPTVVKLDGEWNGQLLGHRFYAW